VDATAIVVSAEVSQGTGILANEPITTAVLQSDSDGSLHTVRILGGPTKNGFARLAGYVVPLKGMRVALDLKQPRQSPPFFLPTTTFTRNLTPGTWASLPVLFTLAAAPSLDFPNAADAIAELDVAARTWSRPLLTSFRAIIGATPQSIMPGDDGNNGVFFHDNGWPVELDKGVLGQTVQHADGSGNYRDSDIHINTTDFRFSLDGSNGTQDLRSVLVHELGHALGLGHSDKSDRATMNASGSGLRWRSLERDDIEGVCSLYPGSKPALLACDPACPANFVCVGGACQRKGDAKDLCSPCPLGGTLGDSCEASGDDARCIDLPNSGGRVCGRACTNDADCGDGFACRSTTEAGDRQCISLTDCKNGANTCATDADCKHFEGVRCRNGVCVGPPTPLPADAGAQDASIPDASTTEDNISAGGGGDCDCRSATATRTRASEVSFLIAALLAACYRRRQQLR
jgi:hypothetical protein